MVEIADLIANLAGAKVTGPLNGAITSVSSSSLAVTAGACFVAVPGKWTDGHTFIGDALARGAALIVGEGPVPEGFPRDRTYVRVADSRRALGTLSATFYGYPSRRLDVIGVTGTDGKTTTTELIHWVLTCAGRRTGLMSTVDFKIGDERWENSSRFTTLEAPEVQKLLARMADARVECAVLETTSSGLALHRVSDVDYDTAVFTNLTEEHLEFHGTLDAYRRAKAMLFEAVDPAREKSAPFAIPQASVLNADDPSCDYMRGFCRARVVTYGVEHDADVRARDLNLAPDATSFSVTFPDGRALRIQTPLVARFNVSNCLAALAVAWLHGIADEVLVRAFATFPGVPGRMERVDMAQPFGVVVDYAHTADSLEKVLQMLRPLTRGRLIAVFGSAGDRDRVKRPRMGAVAARYADFAVITDEDPREEDAAAILREIAAGAEAADAHEGERFVCVVGRRAGIAAALGLARAGDTVLLAGKGHEQSIVIGREKLPWDDQRVAREELRALGYAPGM